jgi:hypothetical protein
MLEPLQSSRVTDSSLPFEAAEQAIPTESGALLPLVLVPARIMGETVGSYSARIDVATGARSGHTWALATVLYREGQELPPRSAVSSSVAERAAWFLCVELAGSRAQSLALLGKTSNVSWHACLLCTSGAVVAVHPEHGRLVCPVHGTWTGPSVGKPRQRPWLVPQPADSHSHRIDPAAVKASERIYATGVSSQLVMDAVRRAASVRRRQWTGIPAAEDLQTAAAILETVMDREVVEAVSNYYQPYRTAYSLVAARMEQASNPSGIPAVEQAWLMLRWTAAAARHRWAGEGLTDDPAPLIEPIRPSYEQANAAEPFNSYLACLQTTERTDSLWWKDRYFRQTAAGPLCLCPEGHVQHLRASDGTRGGARNPRCALCTGRRIVSGFNSLADKAPWLIAEWDQEADQSYTPWNVGPGSGRTGHWVCPTGHTYDAVFGNRVRQGSGCPFCAGIRRSVGTNDLATTHPDLAEMWDPAANNTKTPSELSAGSEARVGWRCPHGHAFIRTPMKLVQTRGLCPVCSGFMVCRGVNDLPTLRPDIAAEWNSQRNGTLKPTHFQPNSTVMAWWICPQGHELQMVIAFRCMAQKSTCPVESGRRFSKGTNDLATKEPRLATEWNDQLNGRVAADVLAGGKAQHWWTCPAGHTQHQTVESRRRAGGCTVCAPGDRVGSTRKD